MIVEDIALTFNTNAFAESIRYLPKKSVAFSMDVIFDDKSVSSLDNLTLAPQFVVAGSAFSGVTPKRGDTAEIRNKLYNILTPEPDGFGTFLIPLEYVKDIT